MRNRSLDVAVTGLHARLPGPADPAKWWAALCAGEALTSTLDPDDLAARGVPRHLLDDPAYVPVRGLLEDAERFDAELFGISPREAELIDPQHRLMLEASWAALEDAGRNPLADRLRTAVFASSSSSKYLPRILGNPAATADTLAALHVGTGRDFMAGRIAYRLGLQGPAVNVLTACSSSLVAVHLAVQALNAGDCDQAVVVAASVGFPQAGHTHLRGGIMSADGRCRPFDARATGTVGGSGVLAVVLRRFEDLGTRSACHGVILGSAVNNDGSAKAGFNAPAPQGQSAVIRAALRSGDVAPGSLGYVETHGTGTYVGDPIEWSALSAALRGAGLAGSIPVGALKANIGHLDAAAGLAALYKALLVLKHGQVPPVANFETLNPLLADLDSPLRVPTETSAWQGPEPRRAGVSSFGIGGTNAHVIVEQAPAAPAAEAPAAAAPAGRTSVLTLSAVRPESLEPTAARLAGALAEPGTDPADAAFTLRAGRAPLAERLAVVGRTGPELAAALRTGPRRVRGRVPQGGPRPLVFLLPGQGAQRPGMALPFQAQLPGFQDELDRCLDAMEPFSAGLAEKAGRALRDPDFPAELLRATELAQPALFALEYAAVRALDGIGLRPVALAGHSLGEVTAACLAGVLDLAAAIELVAVRAAGMQACPPGAMLALSCSEADARALLAEPPTATSGLEVAAVNGPGSCVLSGPAASVRALEERLAGRIPARRLRTSHAFHSAAMEPAAEALRAHLAGRTGGRSTLPHVSTLDGTVVPAGTEVPLTALAEGVRRTVRFGAGIAALRELYPGALAVEVGPGQALAGMAAAAGLESLPLVPGKDPRPEDELALALAGLWAEGQPVELSALIPAGRRLHLPGTTFGGGRHVAPETDWPTAPAPAPQTPAPASEPPAPEPPAAAVAPPSPAAAVADAWRELLGHPDLTEDAEFVASGGDSLLAIRLARRLEQLFTVQVPLRDLLLARTMGDHARLVERLMTPSQKEATDE
ncbi:type I polyketide synthase [Kitasatospora cineracea]|uniref:Acyl transferase domain-containing protein n=1 Tax=Kitasatospora cineracea TaxID=88074 RepID=A0A8G1X7G8_9ACTN|nr:type I polyketide synthase [Kitasatospora cineracea]ROR35309.1 acyl transferase domain-containing protein [Kitasatospora cineracea]